MKFSVVIPVYNSAPTLIELSSQLITFFTNRANEYEIIFTDDYSTDDSWNVLKKIALDNKNIKIVRLAKNNGQHASTLCGIHKSTGDIIITIDDDLQYPVEEIGRLIDFFVSSNYVIAFGIPSLRKGRFMPNVLYKIIFFVIGFFIYPSYRNIKFSSFRIFRKALKENNSFYKGDFKKFNPNYLWHISPKAIGNLSVEHKSRINGSSNYNIIKILKHLSYAFNHVLDKLLKILFAFSLIFEFIMSFNLVNNVFIKEILSSSSITFYTSLLKVASLLVFILLLYIVRYINLQYLYNSKNTSYLIFEEN